MWTAEWRDCSCRTAQCGRVEKWICWATTAGDGGWTLPRAEGHQRKEPHLQELLGPVEIPCGERWHAGTSLGISWQNDVDSSDCHPPNKVKEILAEMHRSISGGHHGANRTVNKVHQHYYWLYLRGNVKRWCLQRDACATNRGTRTKSWGLMHQSIRAPFKRITADIAWPFTENDSGKRYRHGLLHQVATSLNHPQPRGRDSGIHPGDQLHLPLQLPDRAAQRPGPKLRIQVNAGGPAANGGQQNQNNIPTPAVKWNGGMLCEGDREASEEGGLYTPKGLGWEATHLPAGLPSINQWNHWYEACQHGVRPTASPALWPYVWGSPRQGSRWQTTKATLSNGYTSTILPTSTWNWPVTRWRLATTSWPTLLVFKNVTVCGCTALPGREEDHPSCRRTEKARTSTST